MTYKNDDSTTDQAHLLNLKNGFGPPIGTKVPYGSPVHKVVSKLSSDERQIISDRLRHYMTSNPDLNQMKLSAMAGIHVTETNRLVNKNPAKRNKCAVPSIVKMINAVKMVVPNRPDLSYPLVYKSVREAKLKDFLSGPSLPAKKKGRFSDGDRRLISNRLDKYLASLFGGTRISLARKADINIIHIDWLLADNPNDKDRPVCPDMSIISIVNAAKLKVHGRQDLSSPLLVTDQKSADRPEKVKEVPGKPIVKATMTSSGIIVPEKQKVTAPPTDTLVATKFEELPGRTIRSPRLPEEPEKKESVTSEDIPDLPSKKPDLPDRIQQIIDDLEKELTVEDDHMIMAACRYADTSTDGYRQEYFLLKETTRRLKQQIILLKKALE